MKGKMREWLVRGKVRKMRAVEAVKDFASGEKGASHLVEIIVVIVIILAVAAIFRTQMIGAINNIMQQFTSFIGGGE